MPLVKPQCLKSMHTIGLQPQKMNERIEVIMCMDLAGKSGNAIAEELGLTPSRVSIIRNSPLYRTRLDVERDKLKELYREKQTDKLTTGDPVEEALKGAALEAAMKKIELMRSGQSEFVQSSSADGILDRAGYRPHQEKTKVTVEVTDKMADRFEAALRYRTCVERTI